MVSRSLTSYELQKNRIVTAIDRKISNGRYNQSLHDIFKPSKIDINSIENIITAIERKIRKCEIIYYTYFDTEYDSTIIVNNSMPLTSSGHTHKIIETEFTHDINVLQNRIVINTANQYKEIIDSNFQGLILTTASLHENLVKLCETLLKKIVIYDGTKLPYQSIPLKLLVKNWDKLVDLGYRNNDDFYQCFSNHRNFLDKYLNQINTLRNRFIHGYSVNLEVDTLHGEYMVVNHQNFDFPMASGNSIISELILKHFANTIVTDTRSLMTDVIDLFATKLSRSTRIPM